MIEFKLDGGHRMEETFEFKEKKLKLAQNLLTDLKKKDEYPAEVREELEKDMKLCEEKIKQVGQKNKNEIIFTESEVQISGQKSQNKDYSWILVENIILKEKLHWLWCFVILSKFETKNPKWQFKNYLSKKQTILKRNGIKISVLKRAEDDYAILEKIEDGVELNIQDKKESYNQAKIFFNENRIDDAIKELSKITTPKYKCYSFTGVYMKLIEWIRMDDFKNISIDLITICSDFLAWYSKRLRVGISQIEFYKKRLSKNKNKFDELTEEEFQKIKDELNKVEENLRALLQKVPLSKEEEDYEVLVRFLIDTQEKLMYIQEKEDETEETRQETCIQVIIKLQNENKYFSEIIKSAFRLLGDELNRLDKSKVYSENVLRDEYIEIYWLACELLRDLKNFDDFELKKSNKLGLLIEYFNKGMEHKIKKWLR